MIYYTVQTSSSFLVGEAVEKSGSTISSHSTGQVLGVVMSSEEIQPGLYHVKIYAAGGGGTDMILGADWDGTPSRFEFVNGRVSPCATGGHGWLQPELPQTAKASGEIVRGAIYA
jgi:hypothetical protein